MAGMAATGKRWQYKKSKIPAFASKNQEVILPFYNQSRSRTALTRM